ncbi:MAG: hypothetical protein ACXVNO_03530 [Bacteroidia bacterium]
MGRKILSVIAGVLTGILLIFVGEGASHSFFPPPQNIDFHNKEAFTAYVTSIPPQVFTLILAFWLLAAFFAGFVSSKINKANWKRSSIITGTILLAGTILNLFMIPHPIWIIISAVLLTIPAAYFGGKLAS